MAKPEWLALSRYAVRQVLIWAAVLVGMVLVLVAWAVSRLA